MTRTPRLVTIVLLAAGTILFVAAAAAIAVGLFNPQLISDQLPPDAVIDAPAVGGAAVALGVGIGLLGLAHVGVVAALRRGFAVASTAGVVLGAGMAVLSFGFAVSALVSIASDAAPAIVMLPAAAVLGGAVIGYSAATMAILRMQRSAV